MGDRKILLRKKRKLILKLIKCYTNKKNIKNAIANIDKKLLKSHKDEKIENETRAIKYIKTNPKHFFTYTKKKLKTKSIIGPFRINEEIFNTAQDICGKLSEQYESSVSSPDPKYKIDDPKVFSQQGRIRLVPNWKTST